jgi:hypothetical protein
MLFQLERLPPVLVIAIYVRGWFAKMTGLPDKLTKTPHTYAGGGA